MFDKVIEQQNIPQEIISEIEQHYAIDFSRYGTPAIQGDASRMLEYTGPTVPKSEVTPAPDPELWGLGDIAGKVVGYSRRYIARGAWNNEQGTVQLIAVVSVGVEPVIQ